MQDNKKLIIIFIITFSSWFSTSHTYYCVN